MDFENGTNQGAAPASQDIPVMQNGPSPKVEPTGFGSVNGWQAAPSAPAKPKKSMKVAWIVGAIVLLVVIVCVVGVVILMDKNKDDGVVGDVDAVGMSAFEKLTKAEAMDFLRSEWDVNGKLPEGYVSEEILNATIADGNLIVSDLDLIYSYDALDDLRQAVEKKYNGFGRSDVTEDDYEIKEYDYYAIVTPNRIKGATSCDHGYYYDCDSLLSFKRSYLDYYMVETSPSSFNDVAYLNTRDPEVAEYLLRVYSFFSSVSFSGGHGNIYGYSFDDQDDKFVLTVYYIGAGLNLEKLKNGDDGSVSELYAINLFLRRYVADKSDGRMYVMQAGDGTMESVKSFPLTEEEMSFLVGE